MAWSPITSWEIDGETVETVADFIFMGSKITAGGHWNHEIKRRFTPWKKSCESLNLDIILKRRHITMPTKVHLVKAMVFPVVSMGCQSWTTKKAERRRINVFELWCWRRLLRVPWTVRWSNQPILKEISPECSLEGLMLKLKFQYLATWCENWLIWKDLDAGKDWRWEEKGTTEDEMVGWHHWLEGHKLE